MEKFRIVNLNRKIKGKELEKILIESANELEIRTYVKDEVKEEFELRNEQCFKKEVYYRTKIFLSPKGKKYNLAELTIRRGKEESSFSIYYDYAISGTLEGEVVKYLSQVAKNLNSSKPSN